MMPLAKNQKAGDNFNKFDGLGQTDFGLLHRFPEIVWFDYNRSFRSGKKASGVSGLRQLKGLKVRRALMNIDRLIGDVDKVLRVVAGVSVAVRKNPGEAHAEAELNEAERRHSAGLMRVNHVGEVCAQALYDAQGRFARDPALRRQLQQAGQDETDHLAWTAQRVRELGSRTSLLNPLWYAGAYLIGAAASKAGDATSLGFVVETERQVTEHLDGHLQRLPPQDEKSRAIVCQMREDEISHANEALASGASELPRPVGLMMRMAAKVMTTTAYYI